MNILVADVGGTNTRLALAGPGGGLTDAARFGNDGFAGFPDLLRHYLDGRALPPVDACCIAIAGPVGQGRARLTNRDWDFVPDRIAAVLPAPAPVRLINDLAALGHALGGLPDDGLVTVRAGDGPGNGQALVAGLGTGFNVCAVAGGVVFEAEMGHASLPDSVAAELHGPAGAAGFATNEDLFCGDGLVRLHRAMTGEDLGAPDILATRPATAELAARLLGLMARQLVFAYMPLDGIHFAGSVARGLLGSAHAAAFDRAFAAPGGFGGLAARVPVRLIADDGAALIGAVRCAGREGG